MAKFKSEYLMLAYQNFWGYSYLTFKDYIKFKKGQEQTFMDTMIEFRNYCKEHGGHADSRAEDELKYIMKSSTLNWKKVWEQVDIEDYCGPLEAFIEELLRYINWETFRTKVNKSDNYALVKRLYHLYCWHHSIKDSIEDKAFNQYLDETLKRTNRTPEGELRKMIDDFTETFERGHGVDTVETYLQRCKIKIFAILMGKANLNTLVEYNKEKVTLKNLLFYRILKWGDVTNWLGDTDNIMRGNNACLKVDHEKELNVLFNNCDDFIFEGKPLNNDFDEFDRSTLNFMMKNYEESFDIFENKNYQIYDQNQIETLLDTGVYKTNNSPFVDRFARLVRFIGTRNPNTFKKNGAERMEFIDFIYSSKVKVISYATLMIIKSFLDKREFASYIKHLNNEGIEIYFGDSLGLHEDKSIIRTYNSALNSDELTPIEKYEVNSIKMLLDSFKRNNKVYKKTL